MSENSSVPTPGSPSTVPPKYPLKVGTEKGEVPPSEVFRWLGAFNLYQDRLGWSRTQALVIIEGAILAGAFKLKGPLAPALLVVGALIVCGLYKVIKRDWQVRDNTGKELERLCKECGFSPFIEPESGMMKGRTFLKWVVRGVIVTNLTLTLVMAIRLVGHCWPSFLDFLLS